MNNIQKIVTNKYLYIPFLVWLCIQIFKVIYELITTKKFNFRRIIGAGGMPSSHSAVVTTLATLLGKYEGYDTTIFAMSVVFALIVMYDAAGVRRAAGEQAHLLNRIVENGDTVIVIEHNLDVIKVADYIIDLGPEGGDGGGKVVATGTPEAVSKVKESYTGYYLKKIFDEQK